MTFDEFRKSTEAATGSPPGHLSHALRALWHDASGDWSRAHECAQEDPGRDGAWVHAYLHRKEGDLGNAGYWYARAGRQRPDTSSEQEWAELAKALLPP